MASLTLLFINLIVKAAGKNFRQLFILSLCPYWILIFGQLECGAQETDFWLHHKTNKDQLASDIIQSIDNYYYLTGYRSDTTTNYSTNIESYVYKINSSGQIIDSTFFSCLDRRLCFSFLTSDGQDSIVLSGFSTDTNGEFDDTHLDLVRINNQLQILNQRSYHLVSDRTPFRLSTSKCLTNGFLVSGHTHKNASPSLRQFYFKCNSNLDSTGYWEDPQLNKGGRASQSKQLNDSTFWSCELNVYGFTFNQMDTFFNHISYQKIPDDLSDNFGIKWDSDSSFYFLGEWNGGPDDDIGIIRMFDPLDTTGHLFASWGTLDTLDFPASNNGLDFKNKDSIFVGGTANFLGSNSYFFLTQYDSILNLRWERFYGGDGYYQLDKIVATNDGGCIMAGTIIDESCPFLKHDVIIIKVNYEGHIVNIGESPALQAREAILYPNPGGECLNVRLGQQHAEGLLILYSITGQLVLTLHLNNFITIINTQHLPSGSYIYKINNAKGLNESGVWIKE
jgi:hypothetical protein